jgi:hypothetical protein
VRRREFITLLAGASAWPNVIGLALTAPGKTAADQESVNVHRAISSAGGLKAMRTT